MLRPFSGFVMLTDFFMPPSGGAATAGQLCALPANAIAVACRDDRFRRLVRWLGLARCQGAEGAFTCRVADMPGVFGLACEEVCSSGCTQQARFGIYYFPHADEQLCDAMRLDAAVLTQHTAYAARVRGFATDPDFAGLFRTGTLDVLYGSVPAAFGLRLVAENRLRIRCDAGLYSEETGWVVEPGGLEEDLPALLLSRRIYDVLGAALSACLQEAPVFFSRTEYGCGLRHRQADGSVRLDERAEGADAGRRTGELLVWGNVGSLTADIDTGPKPGAEVLSYVACTDCNVQKENMPEEVAAAPCWVAHDLESEACGRMHPVLNDRRPALVVVSGFLGSGKTTFLNNCIEYHRARERFVAVIQNEMGATGVDGHLLGDSASVLALDEGCVCCTLAGSLAAGVRDLTARFNPQVILLETTGLANPLNLLEEMGSLRELVRLECMVTVVDAANGISTLSDSEVARDQIRGADVVVCNKCDVAGPQAVAALKDAVQGLNPRAMIHTTEFGSVHPALFMDAGDGRSGSGLMPAVPAAHADHRHEGYGAVRFFMPRPVSREQLRQAVQQCPGQPFRIKGIVTSAGQDADLRESLLVQHVAGRTDFELLGGFEGKPFVVVIGKNLDDEALYSHWQRLGATRE